MAKKREKKDKKFIPQKDKVVKVTTDDEPSKILDIRDPEKQIKMLLEKGKKKGFLTYEEMNDDLPEDAISPSRLDRLLATLDEMGISLLDETDVESRQVAKVQEEDFETPEDSLSDEESDKEQQLKEDKLLERQLIGEEVARRIDDPIRMYLTQMGQIPLLTRKSEIALARKIEMARMTFRRKMLQCDYCANNSLDLLKITSGSRTNSIHLNVRLIAKQLQRTKWTVCKSSHPPSSLFSLEFSLKNSSIFAY